jgi:hypothetical protein
VLAAFIVITLMTEAAGSSETAVNFYQATWHKNLEVSHLYSGYVNVAENSSSDLPK